MACACRCMLVVGFTLLTYDHLLTVRALAFIETKVLCYLRSWADGLSMRCVSLIQELAFILTRLKIIAYIWQSKLGLAFAIFMFVSPSSCRAGVIVLIRLSFGQNRYLV
jgi:hypothetical protein